MFVVLHGSICLTVSFVIQCHNIACCYLLNMRVNKAKEEANRLMQSFRMFFEAVHMKSQLRTQGLSDGVRGLGRMFL